MLDGTWDFPELARRVEKIHFVVPLADLIRKAACPCLDLIQFMLLLIIPRFAHVDFFIHREPTRSSPVVPGYEHNKAPVYDFIDAMITVLTRLDNFFLEEVLFKSVDRLFRSVIPACVHPLLTRAILPGTVYLSYDRLGQVISICDVNPVT